MRIDTIQVCNFRNFEDYTFTLNPHFTAVIGENGSGKSTVAKAICVALGAYLQPLRDLNSTDKRNILREEVKRNGGGLDKEVYYSYPCSVYAEGLLDGHSIQWKRSLNSLSGKTTTEESKKITSLAINHETLYKDAIKHNNISQRPKLPLMINFGTGRLWFEPKLRTSANKQDTAFRHGYHRCLSDRSDKSTPLSWIKDAFYNKHIGYRLPLKYEEQENLLYAVIEAIETCLPGWIDLTWSTQDDDLAGWMVDDLDAKRWCPLYYLSDGQRTMAAMAAEIAYRAVILNPHLGREAVKETKGVVVIDELDMHLHPKWQRTVVHDLKKAFPNIQFIVTTHSPFIIQSLRSDEVLNLDTHSDAMPLNLDINDVATAIMGVENVYSKENADKEQLATQYLTILQNPNFEQLSSTLDAFESKISDPALRAFLKLNRLAKEGKNTKDGIDVTQ